MARKPWVSLQDKLTKRAFNFEALKNDQIMTLGHALLTGFYEGDHYDDIYTRVMRDRGGSLQNHFAAGMGRLVLAEPRRAKPLLKEAALSDVPLDNIVAAHCAPEVAFHDFPLALDIATYVRFARGRHSVAGSLATLKIERTMPNRGYDVQMAENTMAIAMHEHPLALYGDSPAPRPIPPGLLG